MNWLFRALSLILVFSLAAVASAQSRKTGPGVDRLFAQAQSRGAVRLIVELDPDKVATAATRGAASLTKQQRMQRAADGMLNRLNPADKRGIKRFKHLPFVALETTPRGLQEILASPESVAVYEDRLHAPSLAGSVPLIGGDTAHNSGFTGLGHALAIVDTGVDHTHTFLSPRVVSEACYSTTSSFAGSTSVCPNGQSSQTGVGAARPCEVVDCEHGTHVAGIAAGNGATFDGVARDADIIAIQVYSQFDSSDACQGSPPCVLAWTSDIASGLERVYQLRDSLNIAAVNLSLGDGRHFSACDDDPMKPAIDLLRSVGIATVVASGNNGWSNSISSPACISTAVAVGSTTDSDEVSSFSNSSTLVDLLAPGSLILSSVPDNQFVMLSGSSMATPHVAGAYAMLRSASPAATVDEVLAALASTGVPIVDSRNDLAIPRIQVDQAIAALGAWPSTDLQVTPTGFLASSGQQDGPFTPASITYTVSNGGSGSMDFTLATAADWVTLTPDSGTLGGGQSTTVTVAIGPGADALAPGVYSDTVRFTDTSGTSGSEERPVQLLVTGTGVDNDKFADATSLSAATDSTLGSNQGASKEPGEPDHGGNPGGASVWWQWAAPAAGTLTVNTFGSDFDTTLGLYRGDNVSELTSLAQNDDAGGTGQSQATIDVVAGATYHFAVDGFADQASVATGNITLRWEFEADTTGIGDLSVTPEEGFSATGEVGGPFSPIAKTYTLTNTGAGPLDYTVLTEGDFFDADKTGGQIPIGGSDTVTITLNANANQLPPGTSNGSVFVNGVSRPVTVTATPVGGLNDDFADAATISGAVPVTLQSTNEGATKETGEPDHAGNAGGASLWWSWTLPENGIALIDSFGSNFDTLLAVYRGSALNDLVEVASNDDSGALQSRVSFDATAGEQVWIAVDGFNAATGGVTLNLAVGSKEDVVVDLGSIALWSWRNDAGWLKLNNSSPDRITTGDMDGNGDDDVIADFASTLGGIFVKYNLGGWTQLSNIASQQMISGDLDNNGQDDIVIDAGANGLWARMNNTSWLKLNNASPEQVLVGDMDNNGADDVIGDFGANGIFVKRNLGAWVKLHNSNPEDMDIGNLDNAAGDDLVVDFGPGLALQARMNDSNWLKLHNGSPDVVTTGDIDGNGADDVLAGFGSTVGGFWAKLNLGGWTQQNPNSPEDVVTADVTGNGQDDIVGDFGDTIGGLFIKRDEGAWVKLHNSSPDSMAPGDLD